MTTNSMLVENQFAVNDIFFSNVRNIIQCNQEIQQQRELHTILWWKGPNLWQIEIIVVDSFATKIFCNCW
jgi:hypothetical protein